MTTLQELLDYTETLTEIEWDKAILIQREN